MSQLLEDELLFHKPVLVEEVLQYLDPKPGKIYFDATFGSGGHTRAILEKEPLCRVVALDWDLESIDTYAPALKEEFGDRFKVIWGNFAHLYKILKKEGITQVDGVLADFGTSQMHIFERAGFSVHRDTPLDMRMSPSHQKTTAAHVIANAVPEELREIFWQLGEEQYARQIVDLIILERAKNKIRTTQQLADIVMRAVPKHSKNKKRSIHPATKVFQALRIYVNKELQNIEAFLAISTQLLAVDAVLVCISFHSLEDRIVKEFFHDQAQLLKFEVLTKKVVTATDEELEKNPASRSARLRAARKLA